MVRNAKLAFLFIAFGLTVSLGVCHSTPAFAKSNKSPKKQDEPINYDDPNLSSPRDEIVRAVNICRENSELIGFSQCLSSQGIESAADQAQAAEILKTLRTSKGGRGPSSETMMLPAETSASAPALPASTTDTTRKSKR